VPDSGGSVRQRSESSQPRACRQLASGVALLQEAVEWMRQILLVLAMVLVDLGRHNNGVTTKGGEPKVWCFGFDEKLVGYGSFYSDFLPINHVGRGLKINVFSVLIRSGSC
jgi:hypothetical protein